MKETTPTNHTTTSFLANLYRQLSRQIIVSLVVYSIVIQSLIVAVPQVNAASKARRRGKSPEKSYTAVLADHVTALFSKASRSDEGENPLPLNDLTAFGPKRFKRTHGAPNNYVETFTMPAGCANGTYKIVIKNGEENGTYRISSSEIKLNGTPIYTESEFNQNVYLLEKSVTLAAENTLEIRLASPPTSYLTIEIVGENCGPVDTVPPHLVITSPEDNKATTNQTITITGTAEDLGENPSGIVQVLLNETAISYNPTTKVWVMNLFPLAVGANIVTIKAIDNAGNESTSQVTIIRDLTQPTIAISSPVNGVVTLNQSISVSGNTSDGGIDASGVSTVTVNGVEATLNLVSGDWNVADFPLAVGSNTITAIAFDRAGNQASAQLTTTRVVNQSPTVNAGADQTLELPNTASLNGTVSDDGYPSDSLSVSWAKVSGEGEVVFLNPTNLQTTATFSTQGTYVLRLTASDGQLSNADDVTVTVHPVNQTPTVNAGADQTVELPNAASLVGTATDDGYPLDSALAISWNKVTGPGALHFPVRPAWQPMRSSARQANTCSDSP